MSKERELLRRIFNLTEEYLIQEAEPDFIAEIKVLLEEPEWKPIETAPKDGTRVLIAEPFMSGYNGALAFYADTGEWTNGYGLIYHPSLWHELPGFPEVNKTAGGEA